MKKIKVPLSVDNLKELTKRLDNFKSDIEKANKKIVEDLLKTAEDEIKNGYSSSPYEDTPEFQATYGKTDEKAYVRGTQVVYREFGTGEMGAEDGHPWKADFNLNPYNSGKTIRRAPFTINPEKGILPRRIILDILVQWSKILY